MKERAAASAGFDLSKCTFERFGRARRSTETLDAGQIWTLDTADEPVADRLLSLGIAGVGGFLDGGRDGSSVWLVRKLGTTTLADRLREKRGVWPFQDALQVALSLARSLAACERLSLFAGPIAPEEIAVQGSACSIRADRLVRSMVGAVDGVHTAGTETSPKWTPPEQAGGEPWNSAANRYVLGLFLYRMLGGEHPFSGAGLRHALSAAAEREPPPFVESVARDLPSGLQSYALRMLSPNAADRPATAQAIAEALAGFLRGDAPKITEHKRAESVHNRADDRKGVHTEKDELSVRSAPARDRVASEGPARSRFAGQSWLRYLPAAAAVLAAAGAISLLSPPQEKPKPVSVPAQAPLTAAQTHSTDCGKCHSRQTAEWRRSVMAHAVKSPLFNALESLIEEQFARSFDCPNGAGALRKKDDRTACRSSATGITLTGTGGEHWCVSCHAPSENLENAMPAWDGRPGGDPKTRRPARDLLAERGMEGISCGFCHQVHGPVGARGSRGYLGNPTWISPVSGTTFNSRPEDGRGVFGIANSGYDLRPEELILSGNARNRPPGSFTDPVVHALPSKQATAYLRSSEHCGSCHDVRLFGTDSIGIAKGEHFKRLRNAYTEWTEWAKIEERAGRPASSCQDCHMSTFPGVCISSDETVPAAQPKQAVTGSKWDGICPPGTKFSKRPPGSYPKAFASDNSAETRDAVTHYFSGVDVPLSHEYPDALVDEAAIDINGVPLSAKKRRDLLLRASMRVEVGNGRSSSGALEVPIIVENIGAGHKVPAGFSQEREIWVHVVVRDARDSVVYEVGRVTRGDEDLHDKVFSRVNVGDALSDRQGRPLGMFGADLRDGPDVPEWSPNPALGGTRFRGKGLINFQNGFLRCVRCIGEVAADGSCRPGPGQGVFRADRFDDGDYDIDTGECRSNLSGREAFFETYFPVGALDASRGVLKGPDAIIDTRSLVANTPVTFTYVVPTGGRRGPFKVEARLMFRAFPPFLVKAFIDYEREQVRRGLRPSGALVTDDMLKRLEIVEVGRSVAEVP
ncbi:MAG: hypothetical protein IPK82_00665 [Polyangiaceae bacterium]|nr:hypothetical protein [Polyangiaceae bacterium]